MSTEAPEAIFHAVIVPHRSLSRAGLRRLLLALAAGWAVTGLLFWRLSAWPVLGFSGAELGLAAGLLWLNSRGVRASETLILTSIAMRVIRVEPSGRRSEAVLPAAWLGVRLIEEPARAPRLVLATRDASEEIGRALGAEEKRDLARALRDALDQWRNPRFDNPQLSP